MARKLKSYRLDEELLVEVSAYAARLGCSETQVVEAGLRTLLAGGGIPLRPVVEETPLVKQAVQYKAVVDKAREEFARNLAVRQRGLNAGKERAS